MNICIPNSPTAAASTGFCSSPQTRFSYDGCYIKDSELDIPLHFSLLASSAAYIYGDLKIIYRRIRIEPSNTTSAQARLWLIIQDLFTSKVLLPWTRTVKHYRRKLFSHLIERNTRATLIPRGGVFPH